MIISYIADSAAAKRVEKVLAAVQQFLECSTNRIGKVAETPSVFTMEKWQTLMYAAGPVLLSMPYMRSHLQRLEYTTCPEKGGVTENFCFVLVETFFCDTVVYA